VHVSGHVPRPATDGSEATDDGGHDTDERLAHVYSPMGATLNPVEACGAGDICALTKLGSAETGDTLSDKSEPLVLKPWTMPDPLLPIAVQPHAKTDDDKLSVGLARLAAEDPALRIEQNPETHQTVLWCMGEAHSGIVLDSLANRYAVAVDTVALRVALRETFATKAIGHGRHVKQSGGHGQYAVCDIEVEPLAQGSGFDFVSRVVGGSVPRQFVPSVEKGVRAQMERGLTGEAGEEGYPVVDIRVTLLDGKAHSVDSSDFAFQMAGAAALRDAATAGRVRLLEPIDDVTVLVPDDLVGAVMGDLSARRARVVGTDKVGADRTLVKAEVPQTELIRYAVDLRSLTHGAGSFTRGFARYEPLSESAAAHAYSNA
jgi:elongation factor G